MSVLKLVCLSIMANPTNTITTRMTREIVNLKATDKNLLHIPGLLGLKKIKTKVQCKECKPLGFLAVKPSLPGFTIYAKRIFLVSLVILRTRETRLNKAPEVLM